MINTNRNFPNFIKYMGSKTEILDFIVSGINQIYQEGQPICDLFAGSATLSGTLRGQTEVISNDIQEYSAILAETYLTPYNWDEYPTIEELVILIENRVLSFHEAYPQYNNAFVYGDEITLEEFKEIEASQRVLIDYDKFDEFDDYYLFTRYYSGTYWSYEQCVWIDSVKYVADQFSHIRPLYVAILSSLMFAMAYNSQSTGHYAQYRDAKDQKSMQDILIYRRKNIKDFFVRKFNELRNTLNNSVSIDFTIKAMDYRECLKSLREGTMVYADPPYGLVHYSRFYHAIETLVKYDYPMVAFKGRYRGDRHQSPFCISTQVDQAFEEMFNIIKDKKLNLVLSYSNSTTNTISFTDLIINACIHLNDIIDINDKEKIKERVQHFTATQMVLDGFEENDIEHNEVLTITNKYFMEYINTSINYNIKVLRVPHNHSTMGRREDKSRLVNELLIIAERRG
ncbi:DNA adenine methylase [Bacillus cereus group sp. TH150LC]|uniref:DNA adenine methylase n=1 Tax=Bacillus cereus group sp. TH150LC TaxID=3018061 RepID=UPI0022DED6C0|nr:DNA adenine methylase [Bacillus cereus group sp. TH150LC]MDA1657012.1 DNA adenine methylase [Bacillus cereus group sp. TH150LC]HDR4513815.1 DNA adenine methylase [Bacillus cereus]